LQHIRFDIEGIEEKIESSEKQYSDLLDTDNGFDLLKNKDEWNEEYISTLLVKTRKNFSKEKLDHIIEVRNYVRGVIKKTSELGSKKGNEGKQSVVEMICEKVKMICEEVKKILPGS
ncbi:MAG: hypothetical protein ACRC5T_04125, partial [Cetobacterium sp.]